MTKEAKKLQEAAVQRVLDLKKSGASDDKIKRADATAVVGSRCCFRGGVRNINSEQGVPDDERAEPQVGGSFPFPLSLSPLV